MDLDCISTLVTFEHLSLLSCPDGTSERVGNASPIPGVTSPPISGLPRNAGFCWDRRSEEALKDDTVTYVPFCFQLPRLLPKCSRAKLLFSTFVQGISNHLNHLKPKILLWVYFVLFRILFTSTVQRFSGGWSQRITFWVINSPALSNGTQRNLAGRRWLPSIIEESRVAACS